MEEAGTGAAGFGCRGGSASASGNEGREGQGTTKGEGRGSSRARGLGRWTDLYTPPPHPHLPQWPGMGKVLPTSVSRCYYAREPWGAGLIIPPHSRPGCSRREAGGAGGAVPKVCEESRERGARGGRRSRGVLQIRRGVLQLAGGGEGGGRCPRWVGNEGKPVWAKAGMRLGGCYNFATNKPPFMPGNRGKGGEEGGRTFKTDLRPENEKTLDFSRVLRVVVGDGFEPSNS